jgi:16S rRNA (cytidine1402-2'-O)-methyltransferase
MFYIIPTPIGNLEDITERAKNTFKILDILYCENPKRTNLMLLSYDIKIPKLKRYTEYHEDTLITEILMELGLNKNIGIVSDAGYPVISDPGYKLIRRLKEENIRYESLPGPSSILPALILSGLPPDKFIFLGFLSKKEKKIKDTIDPYLNTTCICFESPYRILKTLKIFKDNYPYMKISVVSEISKIHENTVSGSIDEVYETFFKKTSIKGEIVIVFHIETIGK